LRSELLRQYVESVREDEEDLKKKAGAKP